MVNSSTDNAKESKDLVFFGSNGQREFEIDDLLRSRAEVMGKGSFGTSYLADFEGLDGKVLAVKRLKVLVPAKEFKEMVEELGRMAHDNLLPLIAYYCSNEERLLLFPHMPFGSLSSLLHGSSSSTAQTPLTWKVRSRIAYGIAQGLEYLHSQGPSVCHGNIRSSNVFLTDSYEARLSEFGLIQLVSPYFCPNLVAGYCPPEVKNAQQVSHKADVYSFGVLLLELLTGKPPVDAISKNKGIDLPKRVREMFQENPIVDVFDSRLFGHPNDHQGQMVEILQLAIWCTFQFPNNRPSMAAIATRMKEICKFTA